MTTSRAANPWYREPWPWLLMSGPALVIVAGVATTVIAVKTSDGVVADDYYKQGLGINRTLARDARAAALHLSAAVQFNEQRTGVRVRISGEAAPDALTFTLVHPTRAGGDQAVTLAQVAPGLYEGAIAPPRAGTWRLRLEDTRATWRLTRTWRTGDAAVTVAAAGE